MSELPTGWALAKLRDVATKIGSGATPKGGERAYKNSGTPLIRSMNVHFDGFRSEGIAFLDEGQARALDGVIVQTNDVLLNITGASIGRVTIAPETMHGARVNQHVCIVRPQQGIDPAYLQAFLASPEVQRIIKEENYGVTRQALTKAMIEAINLPVPPWQEQRRLVAKRQSLSTRSSRARHELDRIPKLIERYKQTILEKAFSGALLGKEAIATHKPSDQCWDLPTTWQWMQFEEVAEIASNLVATDTVQHLPHIAPDNIQARAGKLLEFRTVREDGVKSPKHRFYPGQVLYSKIRPYLRKAVIIDFDGVCSADMYPLNPRDGVTARYLYYWMFSSQLASFVLAHEGRTVLPKINQAGLNQTPFPLPPESDQNVIVARLDSAFLWLDKIAVEHARAAHLLPKLDQAILAKAFRGELVPQDPNDEPAFKLLDRLTAQRPPADAARRAKHSKAGIKSRTSRMKL